MRYANLYVLGKPSSLARDIAEYAPDEWVYCERNAEIVSVWACDSYMSSMCIFRLWQDAVENGDSWANEVRQRVESLVVALRLERDEKRRSWVRETVRMLGTSDQFRRCESGGLPRWEVEALVAASIGATLWHQTKPLCSCGKVVRRIVQSARDVDKYADCASAILESLAVNFVDGLRIAGAKEVVAYRLCSDCGSQVAHELEVVVENPDNGWEMKLCFDLRLCLRDLDGQN